MSKQPRETKKPKDKPKTQPEKKAETTILSPDELRAISGGAANPNPPPLLGPQIKKH